MRGGNWFQLGHAGENEFNVCLSHCKTDALFEQCAGGSKALGRAPEEDEPSSEL